MAQDYTKDKIHRAEKGGDLIAYLLKEMGLPSRYADIDSDSEGKILPGGGVNEAGMLLSENGKVYAWWLDWDENKTAPDGTKGWYTLGENEGFFYELTPEEFERRWKHSLDEDERVQRTRKALGLA